MKMDKQQKHFRKVALAELLARGGIVASDSDDMTVVFLPARCGNGNGHFSLSYAGSEKFKRKYGEFVALDRLNDGVCLPITETMFYEFCIAFDLIIRENDPPISGPISNAVARVKDVWPFPNGLRF
jgi:hypothetical protein